METLGGGRMEKHSDIGVIAGGRVSELGER